MLLHILGHRLCARIRNAIATAAPIRLSPAAMMNAISKLPPYVSPITAPRRGPSKAAIE